MFSGNSSSNPYLPGSKLIYQRVISGFGEARKIHVQIAQNDSST